MSYVQFLAPCEPGGASFFSVPEFRVSGKTLGLRLLREQVEGTGRWISFQAEAATVRDHPKLLVSWFSRNPNKQAATLETSEAAA